MERRISAHCARAPDYDAVEELVLDIVDDLRALGEMIEGRELAHRGTYWTITASASPPDAA